MTQNIGAERLHLAYTLCQTLTQAGTPVQLRGIRQAAYETCFVLSPGNGQTVQHILQQASLIKRAVNRRGTRVRRQDDDVLVIVTHDFQLMIILNYLIPLFVPSLLVLNVAAVERCLRLLFNAAPDLVSTVIFIAAVVVLDVCIAHFVPGIIRRSRTVVDREKAEH